jgi:dTDP-4-dehydrorhamnose reductase
MILVTGGNGQLAKCLQDFMSGDVIFQTKEEFDLTKIEKVRAIVKTICPQIIINCAAYTNVEQAEEDPGSADKVNFIGVQNLATVAKEFNSHLIHISTDFVFDGKKNSPYSPQDQTSPINQYGLGKLKGENAILETMDNYTIIRTSWLYSEHNKNFVKTMLNLFEKYESINVVADQMGSPTYASELALCIKKITENIKRPGIIGIHHFSNANETTWYGFACEIAKLTNSSIKINPIKSNEFPMKAERPPYSVLDSSSLTTLLNIKPIDWKESLKVCLEKIS